MVCQSPPPTMSPKVNSDLSFQYTTLQMPSVLTLSSDYLKPKTHHSSHGSARQRLPRWEREAIWWFHLLVFTCQVKQPQLYLWRRSFFLFFFSCCQIRKHACTRQPHYMLFGCLMRAGWKMENVPSVVCLMAGFLSSNHTAGVPGWSRQHPSAGHCREKNTVFQLASSSSLSPLSLQPLPLNFQTRVPQHCAHKIRESGKCLAVRLIIIHYLLMNLLIGFPV